LAKVGITAARFFARPAEFATMVGGLQRSLEGSPQTRCQRGACWVPRPWLGEAAGEDGLAMPRDESVGEWSGDLGDRGWQSL